VRQLQAENLQNPLQLHEPRGYHLQASGSDRQDVCFRLQPGFHRHRKRHPGILERMHKKINVDQIKEAIKIHEPALDSPTIGILIIGSGDEFDTPEYIEKNNQCSSVLCLLATS
jgi:hypothetical protein